MWAVVNRANGNIYRLVMMGGEIRGDVDKVDEQIQNFDIFIASTIPKT